MREAAEALRLTAQDLEKLGVADMVLPEPLGGAQRNHEQTFVAVSDAIAACLEQLKDVKPKDLIKARRQKFLELGSKSL